jgi:hypothetical protein
MGLTGQTPPPPLLARALTSPTVPTPLPPPPSPSCPPPTLALTDLTVQTPPPQPPDPRHPMLHPPLFEQHHGRIPRPKRWTMRSDPCGQG